MAVKRREWESIFETFNIVVLQFSHENHAGAKKNK